MTGPGEPTSTWQEPGAHQKSGWGAWKRPLLPYDRFMEDEGIPVFRDIGIKQVQDIPLEPWARLGGRGSYVQLDGTEGLWGMYVLEIPPGQSLNVEKHLYEEICFVVEGRGTTEVWQTDEHHRQIFEWAEGSLFAIPLNAYHRLVNGSNKRALLIVGTTAPEIMNQLRNTDFIFNCDYIFRDRYDESDGYFRPSEELEPDPLRGLAMLRTNLIPDIINAELPLDNRRSPGYRRVQPNMAGAAFYMFCGQHETGRYSKAHRHAPGAVLMCISGQGYTYTWPSELGTTPWENGHGDKVRRQDYEPVGMVSAAPVSGEWFHQHFGVGPEPLRLLVFAGPKPNHAAGGRPGAPKRDYSSIDVKQGGWAIEYRDEDPHIREEFERMQALAGGHSEMDDEVYSATFEFAASSDGH